MHKTSTYQYKLLDITLNSGTVLHPGKLTVLIGPNNSGKSQALKDIVSLTTLTNPKVGIVVSSVLPEYPSCFEELKDFYDVDIYQDDNRNWFFRTLNSNFSSSKFGR
ncbi:MAG: hypothetical protein ABSA16_12170 [Thermoguttaceae bacterium]|jgi:ABC-type polar amino acid transport system ATPase subunit